MVDDHRPFWVGLAYFDSERKNQIMASELLMSREEISSSKSVVIKRGSGIGMPGRDTPEWVLLEDCWEAFLNKKHEDAIRLLPLVKRKYIIGTLFDRRLLGLYDEVNFFHFSVTAGWVDVAKDLVTKYNFDPKDCFKIWIYGRTLLYHTTSKNHVDVVKYLIGECKCDPMTTNKYGKDNVLHIAATNGLLDVLKCAINNHQCNLEATNLSGQTVLLCASGHIDIVKYLINEYSCDPNVTDKDGNTILHIAAAVGLLDVLKCAINNHQCNLEATNLFGRTVLLCASKHIDIVKYLINECSCDPNATDKDENTILHIAADIGSLNVIKYAIDHHKCNPHAINNDGETVLLCASEHIDIVKYLINECSCDPNATDKNGNTILHIAAAIGLLDVLKCAINNHQCNLEATNLFGRTVLLCASKHIDIVKYLINECSCDPNATDKDGNTILHIAATNGLLDVLKCAINNHQCNLEATNLFGRTVLLCASKHIDIVKYLINECSCDPNATDKDENTILHIAAYIGSLDVLKYAINHHKCNPVNTNRYDMTALHYAINAVNRHMEECYCFPMADSMLHSVAAFQNCVYNLKATNWWCQTIRHCDYKRIDIVKYLIIECNCYPAMATDYCRYTVLRIAATYGLLDVLKYVINNHQATNHMRETVLHCATEHTNVVRFLINECNCDPMATDDNRDTVLHKAATNGSLDVLKCAINHRKCNLEATNRMCETVLHCAIEYTNVVRFLINECNCNPMATDDNRDTVLHKAATNGSLDVLKCAINHRKCNLEATNRMCETVLHCAIEYTNVVRFLINECNCNPMATDDNRDTVLHKAATNGSLDVLKCAINHHQCNLEATNKNHQTVLHCAIEYTNVVRFLINECNCNPMATDNNGDTVLHKAARIGSLDVLKCAINRHQCNLEATNKNHETVLHCAIKYTNVVRFLINECNCNPMATDNNGDTVLHKAATNGSLDVLKCAINHHQCNLEATNKNHQTVLHCAIEYTNVVRFLINECNCNPMATDNNGDTVLHKAATNGSLDVLKCAINHHQCNLEATNYMRQTVLHCAIEHINVVRFLINECNCDPMATDFIGDTVLHKAATNGSLDVLKCAINHHQCNLEATNYMRQTVLHCAIEYTNVVRFLINECNCNPMATDDNGDTVLHKAARIGSFDVLKWAINHHQYNLEATNKQHQTVLHCAIRHIGHYTVKFYYWSAPNTECHCDINTATEWDETIINCPAGHLGHLAIVEFLINECNADPMAFLRIAAEENFLAFMKYLIKHHYCDPTADKTILHCANKHINVVRFLINEYNCDLMATDDNGDTVLHKAATNGSLDVLKWAINHHQCNLEATNKNHQTVLHCAIEYTNVVMFLINEYNCNPMATDDNGDTVLHKAARIGSLDVLKWAINHHQCNLEATNKNHETVLHCAIEHTNVVRFLINECNCDPMTTDKNGQTPLHLAVSLFNSFYSFAAVECLLLTGKCDPVAKDDKGRTPLKMAENRTKILDLFKKYGDIAISHPVDSYVNVLLLGNPGAGKSTLSQVIIDTATGSITLGSLRNVKGVKGCTAGIIPTKLQHKTVGNIILHDFAGHSEYYSSHGAVIENLLQGSGGVFLIVVNILEKEAVKQLHQWLTVVRNEAQKALDQCHIIIVASHVDEISIFHRGQTKEKIHEIIGRERCHSVYLDCRKLGGSGMDSFFNKLSSACESIRSTSGRNLSLYCHMMYGLLEERKENILTLSDVMSAAKDNVDYVLPDEREEVLDVLHSLDSTGLIKVLKSEDKVWVIVNKGILLSEVNGILFAPETFKEHVDIASNTGIVSVSGLTRLFPDYDPDMLICFLQKMELCQEMNPSFLETTNLHQLSERGGRGERLLFFPSLLYSDRPDEMTSKVYQFGWCLQCTGEHHFFPPRYFHVLSLHLAFKFALPKKNETLNCYCTFWRNGLHWFDGHGVGVLVEIVDESQCVLVLMSCEEGYSDNMVRLRRQVIGEVVNVYKKSCSSLEVEELVIDPEKLSYPLKIPRKEIGYGAIKLMSEISNKQDYWVDETGTKHKKLKSILTDESLSDISNISILGGRDIKVKIKMHHHIV